jgi:hypothetical protein
MIDDPAVAANNDALCRVDRLGRPLRIANDVKHDIVCRQRRIIRDELRGNRCRLNKTWIAKARGARVDADARSNKHEPNRLAFTNKRNYVDRANRVFSATVLVCSCLIPQRNKDGDKRAMRIGVIRMMPERLFEHNARIDRHSDGCKQCAKTRHRIGMCWIVAKGRKVCVLRFVDALLGLELPRLHDKRIGVGYRHLAQITRAARRMHGCRLRYGA